MGDAIIKYLVSLTGLISLPLIIIGLIKMIINKSNLGKKKKRIIILLIGIILLFISLISYVIYSSF